MADPPHCPQCARTLDRLNVWATKLRSFQLTLDMFGADRDKVAQVAGMLLDLSEELSALRASPTSTDR
jgi:hypothetical protein